VIATFVIGNSDDKLTQAEWSAFVGDVQAAVDQAVAGGARIQFAGFSAPAAPWQNALWVVEMPWGGSARFKLRSNLSRLARQYRQDSIAWWEEDNATMITPAREMSP
jgi:hypothetical protein